jgi:hypothetical protein
MGFDLRFSHFRKSNSRDGHDGRYGHNGRAETKIKVVSGSNGFFCGQPRNKFQGGIL